jgi:putative acetyltransferase
MGRRGVARLWRLEGTEPRAWRGEVHADTRGAAPQRGGSGGAIAHRADGERTRYRTLSLETGSHPAFVPAQRLYQDFGFTYCGPFGGYRENPNSVFMSLRLAPGVA